MTEKQSKQPRHLEIFLSARTLYYLCEKLKMSAGELTEALGWNPWSDLGRKAPDETVDVGVRSRCLVYLCGLHGFDFYALQWEAEERVTAAEIAKTVRTPVQRVEDMIRASGIPLFSEEPMAITRADVLLFAINPKQSARLSKLLQENPLRVWRKDNGWSLFQLCKAVGESGVLVGEWECGAASPVQPRHVAKLSEICGESIYYQLIKWMKRWVNAHRYIKGSSLLVPSEVQTDPSRNAKVRPPSETHSIALLAFAQPQAQSPATLRRYAPLTARFRKQGQREPS